MNAYWCGCFFAVLYIGVMGAGCGSVWAFGRPLAEDLALATLGLPDVHFVSRAGFVSFLLHLVLAAVDRLAELLNVISRFVFPANNIVGIGSILVRCAILFASAHTLLEEGHVRVDVNSLSERRRAK